MADEDGANQMGVIRYAQDAVYGTLILLGGIAVPVALIVGFRFLLGVLYVGGLWLFQIGSLVAFWELASGWFKSEDGVDSSGAPHPGKSSADNSSEVIGNVVAGVLITGFFAAAGWTVYQSGIVVWRPEVLTEYAFIDGRLLLFAIIAWSLYFMTR